MLPYVVGVVLSIGVALFARWVGFDRDRAFYPTVLIVIASYYILFAVMSGSVETVLLESIIMTLFAVAAVAGFKGSAWIVVAALAGHGVQDAVHGHIISNAGVPAWWPAWCLAYDVGAAGALAWFLMRADAVARGSEYQNLRNRRAFFSQRTPSSSTSNKRVAFGGMTPPAPRLPYPRFGGITSVRCPCTFMPATPSYHPWITWPAPSRNSNGSLRSRELSNLAPW